MILVDLILVWQLHGMGKSFDYSDEILNLVKFEAITDISRYSRKLVSVCFAMSYDFVS